ncbi:MAG: metallophosphoesterase [Balneolaceae bacterium]|nr:metallophosphoesterase [Balneolaceae bacterium]
MTALGQSPNTVNSSEPQNMFEFPTSSDNASFHFTSYPDLFNWNIGYPQPGWEEAMDWFLEGMKKEGPAFSLNAGDIMDARWWSGENQVRTKTEEYWGGFKQRFEDKNIRLYIAPGDHEYGDDQGLSKMDLAPVFAEQFASIFDMPRNGPEHKKGLSYSFTKENLAVISVDTFEDAGNRMAMTVSGRQLQWLRQTLEKYQDKEFIIVQGHVPVVGPVESKNSSANMLEGGTDSAFWKTMVEYNVDAYLCGEHHRITAKKRDGIWQIVHGALWGTQSDLNYLRGSVSPGILTFRLFEFDVSYSGGYIGDHPHRGETNKPREIVTISEETLKNGPRQAGELVIEAGENGNRTTRATGHFEKKDR